MGWHTVCAVEVGDYPRRILLARQRDGILPHFPIWDDVRTFDGRPWRGRVDVISGGFPCTDISTAGHCVGIEGEFSGLWDEFSRVIREVRPPFVFVENSANLTVRGLDRVLGDLAAVGFDAEWGVFGAHDVGAPHYRKRIWVLAYSERSAVEDYARRGKSKRVGWQPQPSAWHESWESALRRLRGMDARLAHHVDRTDCIRNAQVPSVARLAFETLIDAAHERQ